VGHSKAGGGNLGRWASFEGEEDVYSKVKKNKGNATSEERGEEGIRMRELVPRRKIQQFRG